MKPHRIFGHYLIALALVVCTHGVCHATAAEATKPNILFLIADDVSYWAIHSMGNDEVRTPHLDRLADRGMTVTLPTAKPYQAHAYPVRLPFSGTIPSTPVLTLTPGFQFEDAGSGVLTGKKQKPNKSDLVRLSEGNYTMAQLRAAEIPNNSIENGSSHQV